jgi:hypothetical protein
MFVVLVSDELVENSQFRAPDGPAQLTSYSGLWNWIQNMASRPLVQAVVPV